MHKSISTIDSPEFINLQPLDINPLMSECEIKVFYIGENRNRSYINKSVALEMAKTLRGAPIVGYYKTEKEDFTDHGEVITIDDDGIHVSCKTQPYGFVAPNAKVWFKKFDEEDSNGNIITREYLMTTGYLWTGQYPECKCVVEGDGKPHSMEFDEPTLQGQWEMNSENLEFFIVNDAIFSKLCVLGDAVEPCFEGSLITKPEISKNFELDDKTFKNTLFSMMRELENALKGGQQMEKEKFSVEQDNFEENSSVETEIEVETDFVVKAKEESEKEDESSKSSSDEEEKEDEEEKPETKNVCAKDDDEDKKPSKHELEIALESLQNELQKLQEENQRLQTTFEALENKNRELESFKTEVENERKTELINSFFMLDDEDKAEFIKNKEKYSYAEIKSALSVICFDKKVSFTVEKDAQESHSGVTVPVQEEREKNLSDWVKAVKAYQDNI